MGTYIVGLIMITAGIILVIKTEWFLSFFGRVDWAEDKLGVEGGTRLFYKLLGLASIFLAFLLMAGIIERTVENIFTR